MLKVEVSSAKKDTTPDYPFIGISKDNVIVLFHRKMCGTCLDPAVEPRYHIGYHSTGWDMDCFRPLESTVTLSNK